ncbi:UNVERIFIED_CONTAM: Ubiquitin-related modifier 11 [Sesamum angustifolium]|uniref:Ubiquitin-related modifier 1 homolog n=1 Tax=Sesamum angustifolium TaxID=2727405 RepID=A0AAW2L4M4_9LAMI
MDPEPGRVGSRYLARLPNSRPGLGFATTLPLRVENTATLVENDGLALWRNLSEFRTGSRLSKLCSSLSNSGNFVFFFFGFSFRRLIVQLRKIASTVKIHNVNVEPQAEGKKLTMRHLLSWVRTNLIKERPEMFMKGDTVRPGVLVLVNDCDWELSGQLETVLEEKDVVVFISTLHGG